MTGGKKNGVTGNKRVGTRGRSKFRAHLTSTETVQLMENMMPTNSKRANSPKIGRPPGVDDAEIIAAGEALETEGRNVSGFALRSRLHSGEPKRLIAVWRAHKEENVEHGNGETTIPLDFQDTVRTLSNRVSGEIEKLAQKLFAHASEIAETRLTEERRQLAEQRQELSAESDDASRLVAELEAKVADLRAEIRTQQVARAEAEQRANALDKQLAVATARLSDQQDSVAVLRKERDTAIDHRDVWLDDAAEAWGEVQRLQEANASLREQVATFKAGGKCSAKAENAASTGQPEGKTLKDSNPETKERKEKRKEERKEPAQRRIHQQVGQPGASRETLIHNNDGTRKGHLSNK